MSHDDFVVIIILPGLQSQRIYRIHRIIRHIGIQIHPAAEEDRIGLPEAPERGIVGAGAVMQEAARREVHLARIAEQPRIRSARPAEFIIGIDRRRHARSVRRRNLPHKFGQSQCDQNKRLISRVAILELNVR